MSEETKKVYNYLEAVYKQNPRLCDIFHTFCFCSRDNNSQRNLVSSNIRCINFDKLTKWLHEKAVPQSADSMTFSGSYIYLIEFKAGNQVEHYNKRYKLIRGVIGKINDSEETLFSKVFPNVEGLNEKSIKIRFFLVVDTKEMGISALASQLALLSNSPTVRADPNISLLFQKVLPDLKTGTNHPERFNTIDIWYSELFESYLNAHGIIDIASIFPDESA